MDNWRINKLIGEIFIRIVHICMCIIKWQYKISRIMTVKDHVRLVFYRMHDKGLEIFMIATKEGLPESLFPGNVAFHSLKDKEMIALQDGQDDEGNKVQTYAIECDSHEIPRIRSLIKEDFRMLKNQVFSMIPDLEKGTYIAFKNIIKKAMPEEYAALKELKDVLLDRNVVSNI